MALGNGNPKEGDKGSNFFWELKVLQGLEAIAVAIEAGGGGGGGGGGITALTGDVTAGPGSGSVAATIGALKVTGPKIANNAVTFAKMQNISNFTFLGNSTVSAGTGAVVEIPLTTIPYYSGGIGGTANGTTFLRGDGQWAIPPATPGGTYSAYSILANNTNAAAAPTSVTYKYAGSTGFNQASVVFSGGATLGAGVYFYNWHQNGNLVTFEFMIMPNTPVVVPTNTNLIWPMPTGMPSPVVPAGISTGDIMQRMFMTVAPSRTLGVSGVATFSGGLRYQTTSPTSFDFAFASQAAGNINGASFTIQGTYFTS